MSNSNEVSKSTEKTFRPRSSDDVTAKYNHANHGTNYFMPFYHEWMGEFQTAMFERAKFIGGENVATTLFDPYTGVCAINPNTKMVYAPPDIPAVCRDTLNKMGILSCILVCIREGFLWSLIADSGKYSQQNYAHISELIKHMKKEHNAIIFTVGYDDDEFTRDPVLARFIKHNGLRIAKSEPGRGLSTAITNAKYALTNEMIFSRTLYMDNIGNEPDEGFESGFRVAAESHAAPLISRYIARCPKCHERWMGYKTR